MTRPIQLLELTGNDSLALGHQHGESFRHSIHEIAEIRLERICALLPHPKVADVLSLAGAHLPVLEKFSSELFLELRGIAESSNVSLERLIVLNNYTDLRDIPMDGQRGRNPEKEDNGGCSIIFSPTTNGPVLGQTWDIHGSAEPYVILLKARGTVLFTIMGCLGMTGLNHDGVAIAINNLASIDAKVGVIWPALIRQALTARTAVEAKDVVMNADLGSGRHFAVADQHQFFGIEASASKKKIIATDNALYFHTNHCLDEEMRKTHVIRKESTTLWRYQHLDEVTRLEDLSSGENVFLSLADVSLPQTAAEPHATATCGTFVMDIAKRTVLACVGVANEEALTWPQTTIQVA